MVQNHGKKKRAKQRAQRAGAGHQPSVTNTLHTHEPLPDMAVLSLVPHGAGRALDVDLAARLVAACRARCGPCQKSLATKVRQNRPTLAALAGVVFGLLPTVGVLASAATREWAPLARDAKARNSGAEALAAVEAMTDEQVSELLEDALDHWAAGGVPEEQIAGLIKFVGTDGPAGAHVHAEPDTGLMEGMLPYVDGWQINHTLATKVVSAVWAGCDSCQEKLTPQVVADRATLAGLAGAVFLTPAHAPRQETPAAGPVARAWIEQAHGKSRTSGAETVLRAVAELDEDDAEDLLEEALDVWDDSGAAQAGIGLGSIRQVPPRQRPADPMDTFRAAGIEVITLDDLDVDLDGIDTYHLAENYGVFIGQTATLEGRPMPMLTLYPETEGAGIQDLEHRTDWAHWGLHGVPDMDPHWRLRANIADRALQGLVHVGPDGEDDIELWRAAEKVSLPAEWWDLLDQVQHVLVAGPVKEGSHQALQAAGDAGELLAVVARVTFT
ncbi:hypothetical protein ACGF5O_44990 [Streptomyces sp. NPDC048291]|uniref:hypothetical protein n=1 Tax=Streptomyces sp. NPDC048291 TaxID=3365530 RepID=UPI00371D3A83